MIKDTFTKKGTIFPLKIKIFSDFCSSEGAIKTFINLNELEKDDEYNRLYSFTTNEDYTHAILMNKAMPTLRIPKENVIGIAFEPLEFMNLTSIFCSYAQRFIGKYYIGNAVGLKAPFVEGFGYMWHTPLKEKIKDKPKKMSFMISEKNFAPGHIYRHKLAEKILLSDLNIDIFGRGCEYHLMRGNIDTRLKGSFDNHTEMLDDYEYHIAIENYTSPHYFSEKLMDPLLCNTVPVYLGCMNYNNYFDKMVIGLTGDLEKDMGIIEELLKSPSDKRINIDLEKVKNVISIKNLINELKGGINFP